MSGPERAPGDRALLRFLARQGRVTNDDVTRVEGLLEEPGTTVHDVLEREGIIGQKDLALLLADTLRLRLVDLTTYPLDANVTRELKETIATRYEVVPISIDERTIEVVTANPLDLEGLKAVEFATGKRVQAVVATHIEVKDALAHTYRLQESLEQFLQLVPSGESLVVKELSDEGGDLRTIAAEAELPPVIKLADKMLIEGIKTRASDIHVEPGTDSVLVRYRVDGILEEGFRFPKWVQNSLVARLKVMAKLDITERRLPQDGRIQVRYQDKSVDMRVSSLPAQHGEKITLRILDASQAVKVLDRLGLSAGDLKLIRDAAKKPQGMILITGPTGSGKTTTLYALLREIFSPKTNIVTIENPIEYQLKGINQVEVNDKQGLTFGGVLRSVLRQDPDVILLGEIRDKETAQIAFQAANTGHLVLSTVHTNDAAGAVTRLLDLGLEPYAVASALNLVVAQRLVRQLCPGCSTATQLDEETRRQLHLGTAEGTFKHSAGCAQCRHTGYRSRLGIYEMLPMTTAMTKLIEAGAGESMVRQQARTEGVHTLLDDAAEKLRGGLTSVEELLRVVQITEAGGTQCPGCKKEIAEDYSVCPHCSRTLRTTCSGCTKPLNPEWVRCPYCGATAADAASPELPAGAVERRSFKALVVDDTATIRDVVQHTLEHSDLGLSVVTAENGPQALEIASRDRPDIVILDISMPEMDGFEVCRRLRSEMRTAFVPVLMLTAHDSEDDVARGFGVGADDYMVKPFRREGLVARVRRILERTYGSQVLGGAAPDLDVTPVAVALAASAPPSRTPVAASGIDVAAALAQLATDHDALRRSVEGCEARIGELAARPSQHGHAEPGSGDPPPGFAELRSLLAEMQAAQERALRELRDETARAQALAEEALRTARATPPAIDPAHLTTMMTAVERLQGEQVRLAGAVESARQEGSGADAECERRLRQVALDIEQARGGVEEMRAAWQREANEIRAQARSHADEAQQSAQGEAAAAVARLTQNLSELRAELATQRDVQARDGARVRSAQESAERAQADATATAEQATRELAALQRALAEQREQREQDVRRVAGAEDAARRVRTEATTAVEQMAGELAALRRALAEQRDGGAQIGERLDGAEEAARNARADVTAASAQLGGELAELKQAWAEYHEGHARDGVRLDGVEEAARMARAEAAAAADQAGREVAELRQAMTVQQSLGMVREDAEALVLRVQSDAIAAAEAAARAAQGETMAATEQTARDLEQLRQVVTERQGAQEREMQQVLGRLGRARRAAGKLVRRVRAATLAVDARAEAREQECERQLAMVQEQTTTAVTELRHDHAELTREVRERLAELPSATEQRTVLAFLDGCETQLTEFAARLDAQGAVRAASDAEADAHLRTRIDALATVTERLDGEQRRLAADVEERLRGLMRTAAGGFDVQLALLRGKVEVLARSLREQVPIDPDAGEALLGQRHGLLDRLREQLVSLKSSAEWAPQRILDLLVESTLAAAVTPFRRMLQLGTDETSLETVAAAEAIDQHVTDGSASPSLDP